MLDSYAGTTIATCGSDACARKNLWKSEPWMQTSLTAKQLFEFEEIESNCFRSRSVQTNHTASAYGGQLLAQALAAAIRVTPKKQPHSLHAYFLRPGSPAAPIDYHVERLRDGRRIATRRVSAHQNGKQVFQMQCSFATAIDGFEHQIAAPLGQVPGPAEASLLSEYVVRHAKDLPARAVTNYSGAFPLELRLVDPESCFFRLLAEPKRGFWVRMPSAAEIDDPALHRCLVAFASDYWLAGVAAGTHVPPTNRDTLQILSLDHAMWFHRPARADQWMLYLTDSPSAQEGRGLARGLLYDAAGVLVAATAQECLFLAS